MGVCSQACPKYPKQQLCNNFVISRGKHEVDFLPADKHQSFLQGDVIILVVCGQACSNCPKWQVCYFFAISSERSEWWSLFFACRQAWKLAINWYYDFDGDGQAFPKFWK